MIVRISLFKRAKNSDKKLKVFEQEFYNLGRALHCKSLDNNSVQSAKLIYAETVLFLGENLRD